MNTKEAKSFFNFNHIQGGISVQKAYGLYYDGELVCCMAFNIKSRNIKENEVDLVRFCNKINHSVVGGFSKIFSKIPYSEIISYSDNRISNGNLYKVNGFNHVKNLPVDYHYLDKGIRKRINKSNFKKSKIKKSFPNVDIENKTEREIMEELGYLRIYDAGKKKWSIKKGLE